MEAKKQQIECRNCQETLTVDFATDKFATEVRVANGKRTETRTFIKQCPNCQAINHVRSTNKKDWGNRKGPKVKFLMFSSLLGCLAFVVIGILALYFAFQGVVTIFDWITQ